MKIERTKLLVIVMFGSLFISGAKYLAVKVENYLPLVAPAIASAFAFLLYRFRKAIIFAVTLRNRELRDQSNFLKMLGFKSLWFRDGYVLAVGMEKGVLYGMAFFKVHFPYSLDSIDERKRQSYISPLSRLTELGINLAFTTVVSVTSAKQMVKDLDRQVAEIKSRKNEDGVATDPGSFATIRQLQRKRELIASGQPVRKVATWVAVIVAGEQDAGLAADEFVIRRELEANSKVVASILRVMGAKYERSRYLALLDGLKAFFLAPSSALLEKSKGGTAVMAHEAASTISMLPMTRQEQHIVQGPLLGVTGASGLSDINSSGADTSLFSLDETRTNSMHKVCIGQTGAGKSTSMKTLIIRHLSEHPQTRFLLIDDTAEHSESIEKVGGTTIDCSKQRLDFFDLAGRPLPETIMQLMGTFTTILELSTPQREILSKLITRAYTEKGFLLDNPKSWQSSKRRPTTGDIIRLITDSEQAAKKKNSGFGNPAELSSLTTLQRKLEAITYGPLGMFVDQSSEPVPLSELFRGLVVLDLSKVRNDKLKEFIVYATLDFVDNKVKSRQANEDTIIYLEEAWKLRPIQNLLEILTREGRKNRCFLWMSSQRAHDISSTIMANVGTAIVHRTEHPDDLAFLEKAMGLNEEERELIQNASVGQALVKTGNQKQFVRMDRADLSEISEIIRLRQQQGKNVGAEKKFSDIPDKINSSTINGKLSEAARRLLEEIASDLGNTTTDYYKLAEMKPAKGNEAIKELKDKGLVTPVQLPRINGGSGITYDITESGYAVLGRTSERKRNGGALHHWMGKQIQKKFAGHDVILEYDLEGGGKATDIVVDDISIELEVHQLNPDNISKNLEAGFDKVMIVTSSKEKAESFNLKIQQLFPNETRAEAVDVATFLDKPEQYVQVAL